MSEQRLLQIRTSIALAMEKEAQTQRLQLYIEGSMPELHHLICLPEQNSSVTLMGFVTRYIQHVPDFIEALRDYSKEAEIGEFANIFINIIEDFFISPPELIQKHEGLHALFDEAYLAHRLIEELNDRLMILCGSPLVPMDMTVSNIIVHDLIGEDFANQLDLAVHYSVEALFASSEYKDTTLFCKYVEKQKQGWENTLERWPCLAGDSSITLSLDPNASIKTSEDTETFH